MRSEEVIQRFADALGNDRQARKFIGSVLLVVSQSEQLMECTPKSIMISGMRAANLKLSVDPAIGHGYIVRYNNKGIPTATFIIGYKGIKQLAYRTGQYLFINEKIVFEGQSIDEDDFTGIQKVVGMPTYYKDGFKPIGYWMAYGLKNGFRQTLYMTKEEMLAHAMRYSKTYDKIKKEWKQGSLWASDFDKMAIKTVIRMGLKDAFMDEDDALELSESEYEDDENEIFTDEYVEGELLESALQQQAEKDAELASKSTEELSAMLGFEDEPDTSKKPAPVKKSPAKKDPEKKPADPASVPEPTRASNRDIEMAGSFQSKRLNKPYARMTIDELRGEIQALSKYEPKNQEEKVKTNDRISACKQLIKHIETNQI